jgi:hypothetical protein
MVDEELVRFHDGELAEDDACRVRLELADDPQRQAELETIDRIDRGARELVQGSEPTPRQVASGKARLKAALQSKQKAAPRRRIVPLVAALTSAAAVLAIIWHLQVEPEIGTIRYNTAAAALGATSQEEPLKSNSAVRVGGQMAARIQIPDVAKLVLGSRSALTTSDRADLVELVRGGLSVETTAAYTITIKDSRYVINVEPGSTLRVFAGSTKVHIDQRAGTSHVSGMGGEGKTITAPARLELVIPHPERDLHKNEIGQEALRVYAD